MQTMTDHELQLKSFALRRAMLNLIVNAGAGHTGGGLSCMDILNVLYNRVLNVSPQTITNPTRDRYVQSKGHCVEALYTVLGDRGFFPASDLDTVCHYQSHYVGHPTRHIPGIEMNTGALRIPRLGVGQQRPGSWTSGSEFQDHYKAASSIHRIPILGQEPAAFYSLRGGLRFQYSPVWHVFQIVGHSIIGVPASVNWDSFSPLVAVLQFPQRRIQGNPGVMEQNDGPRQVL